MSVRHQNPPETVASLYASATRLAYHYCHRLVRRLPPWMVRHCGGREEIEAEALFALCKAATYYEPGKLNRDGKAAVFGTYARTAIKNHLQNYLDAQLQRAMPCSQLQPHQDAADPAPSADHGLTVRDTLASVQRALLRLDPRDREVLVLLGEGLTWREIRARLRCGDETIRYRRARGLKRLQALTGE